MTDLLTDPEAAPTPTDPIEKRLADKDEYISRLEAEAAEARQELRARTSLEELVAKMAVKPAAETTASQPETPPVNTPNLTEEVRKALEAENLRAKRAANLEQARLGLKTRFGDDYDGALRTMASKLGVSTKWIADMAAQSPDGLLQLADTMKPEGYRGSAPPASTVNSGAVPDNSAKKNSAYYREIRKKDINQYLSPKVQNEMHAEAVKQGPKFYEP